METIVKTLEVVTTSARTHKNPKTRVISKEKTLPIGHTVRQGDVMITRHALGTKFKGLTATDNRQLAPGATVGSRHILRADKSLKIQNRKGAGVLQGPIVDAPEGFYLEHPTHAHMDCKLPGTYEVSYPRDFAAEGLQRRKD